MIDRKTALRCAALIVLMLIMAVWRIITLEHWTIAGENGAPFSSLWLLLFPAFSAFFVGVLYRVRLRADAAKVEPWRKWGAFLSISHCGGLLLVQAMLIIGSLKLDLPVHLSAIGRTLAIMIAIVSLLAINQMPKLPKLPYFKPRLWDMGPIYGPRYVRIQSRILALFVITMMAYYVAAELSMARHSTLFVLLAVAFLMLWIIASRIYLSRKWKLQQSAERGLEA